MRRTVKIGEVAVDAGIVLVGDPCYHWEEKDNLKQQIGTSWDAFCAATEECQLYQSFDRLGVVVSTGGDGVFPVYAEIENGRVRSVTIQFESDESDDEYEWTPDGDEEEPYDENVW